LTPNSGTVFIIDDDPRVREALCDLLDAHNLVSVAFSRVADYVAFDRPDVPSCLLLDIELPDTSGLEYQMQIDHEDAPPIVFLTGHGNIRLSVSAMKRGAVDFLTKPFLDVELMSSVQAAIETDRIRRRQNSEVQILQKRLALLTPREQQVLPLVASGLLNKQAAAELGISEVTLQIHRGKIMRKMQAGSLAELVRIADRLKISSSSSRHAGSIGK
jgi:FixJ family two-component response regulator